MNTSTIGILARNNSNRIPSPIGIGNHYRNIVELVNDKHRMDMVADALEISSHHVRRDTCNQWSIIGAAAVFERIPHLQAADDDRYLLYVPAYSVRKWGAIKRKAQSFGWEVVQDGDDEGTLLFHLPDAQEARFLRTLLGLRQRRGTSEKRTSNEGVSLL